jgi:hypothetical protein
MCVATRACACVRARAYRSREPFPSARTACGFCAQALYSASAFNANIGAWNIARVTTLYQVCAASGSAAAPPQASRTRSAGLRMRRGRFVRGGTADARAHAHMWRHSVARVTVDVGMAARRRDSIYANMYIFIYVYTYIIHIYIHICMCI